MVGSVVTTSASSVDGAAAAVEHEAATRATTNIITIIIGPVGRSVFERICDLLSSVIARYETPGIPGMGTNPHAVGTAAQSPSAELGGAAGRADLEALAARVAECLVGAVDR